MTDEWIDPFPWVSPDGHSSRDARRWAGWTHQPRTKEQFDAERQTKLEHTYPWLTEHDREVAERAWTQGYLWGTDRWLGGGFNPDDAPNPYRAVPACGSYEKEEER